MNSFTKKETLLGGNIMIRKITKNYIRTIWNVPLEFMNPSPAKVQIHLERALFGPVCVVIDSERALKLTDDVGAEARVWLR